MADTPDTNEAMQTADEVVAESQAPPFNRRLLLVLPALALLAVLGGVLWWRRAPAPAVEAKKAEAPAEAAPVAPPGAIALTEGQLKQITVEPVVMRQAGAARETTGRVGFNEDRMTPLYPHASGRIVELRANKGDVVRAGQVLAVMESPEVILAQNELAAARAAESEASVAEDTARAARDRARSLREREAISTKDLQQAEADYARAKDEQHRTRAAVRVAENRLSLFGKSQQEIAQFGDLGRKNVGAVDNRIELRAPISGTIVERKVGPGQYVKTENAEPLFLISDLSSLWVLADIYEGYLAQIHVGAPATISVAAYPDRKFPARISFINPTLDATTRTVHVRCVVPNPTGLLKPEMFARINIGASVPQSAPAVPTGAIIAQGNQHYVLVEEAHGQFRPRQVTPGDEQNGFTTISAGLNAGDRVVTHGVLLLNGMVGKAPEGQKGEK